MVRDNLPQKIKDRETKWVGYYLTNYLKDKVGNDRIEGYVGKNYIIEWVVT